MNLYRRIGGLEIAAVAAVAWLVLYRRIGGLEIEKMADMEGTLLYRRIGGLEKIRCHYTRTV